MMQKKPFCEQKIKTMIVFIAVLSILVMGFAVIGAVRKGNVLERNTGKMAAGMGGPQLRHGQQVGMVQGYPPVTSAHQGFIGRPPPNIVAGSIPHHGDRGPCTNCHIVLDSTGLAVPPISAQSVMPHNYRGVCNNCHHLVHIK